MAAKRDRSDVDEGEITDDGQVSDDGALPPSPKRAKRLTGALPRHHHQSSAIDPTWGQKYVFSSLDDASSIPYGDEDAYEDDAAAMAYLRAVRHEAYSIPHLLAAPATPFGPQLPPELQREHDAEARPTAGASAGAYYDDGAYVAEPDSDDGADDQDDAYDGRDGVDNDGHVNGQGDDKTELHEAYYVSILARYRRLRALLHAPAPPDAARRLSSAQPTRAAPSATRLWSRALRAADPHPLQLALMSKDTALRVLRILLGGTFLRRGYSLSERTSHWLWGLLARLPDPWELDSADVAWVRDLGRRAVLLGRSLAEMAALRDELEDGTLGVHETVDAGSSDADSDARAVDDGPGDEPARTEPEPADDASVSEAQDEPQEQASGPNDGPQEGGVSDVGSDSGSVAMDLSSDSEPADDAAVLEAAKRALLARVQGAATSTDAAADAARLRLRINMRATLDMILTVAGDFYGQRDLLEFREPFVGL